MIVVVMIVMSVMSGVGVTLALVSVRVRGGHYGSVHRLFRQIRLARLLFRLVHRNPLQSRCHAYLRYVRMTSISSSAL